MANKKISELESRASLSLSDLMAVGDPSTGYLYKTTISDLKTLTGAGVVSFNGRFGTVNPAEGDYTLTQLGDVIITSAANGDVLKYNGSNWVNTQLYTGTVAQYIDGTGAYQTFPTLLSSDRLVTNVRNTSGATITKGTVVYLNGSSGTLPTIAKAQANAESTSTGTYGVVQDNIANNANGYVVVIGNLTALDTSAYNAGDILWLSPTVAGGYTTTKPVAPNHAVYVGIVTRSSNTQGTIEVKIQNGYELDELHNVLITSVANNDVLVYETASSLWKNKAFSTLSTDTLDSVTGRGNTTTNDITVGSVTAAGLSNLLGQIRTFVTTGNIYMGANPTSATDAGFKLDVLGTTRLNGNTTVTGVLTGSDTIRSTNGTVTVSISYGSTAGIIGTTSNHSLEIRTNNTYRVGVSTAGVVNIANLIGTGSRMVVADSAGNLSTQAIPTSAVSSVFGRTGAVVAASGDYTTSQVTEGTNLYFTDARSRAAISAGTGISYNSTTGEVSSSITQYTDALARAAVSLTTTGTSGAATYNSTTGVLNIPQYIGGVTSVFGRTGAVTAQSGDYNTSQVTENTNLYYTEGRVSANTDVAANTAARHNAVTIGTANGLSLSTQVLSLDLSSGSTTGALSSTDWNTFNGKQGALTLTTTGTSGAATLIGNTLNIPQYSGGGGMAIGGSITSATEGSVLFAGGSGVLSQDNANFFWDDINNRLGIGTTNPTARLHIVSGQASIPDLYVQGAGTLQGWLGFGNNADYSIQGGGDYSAMNFIAGGSTRLNITSGGNVGINTTTVGSRLQVNGNAAIGYSASTAAPTNGLAVAGNVGVGVIVSNSNWTTRSVLQLGGFGTSLSSFNAGGGATELMHNAVVTTGFSYNYLLSTGATRQYMDGDNFIFYNAPTGTAGAAITFTERMRIGTNVGIGTSTIGSKLQVNGNAAIGYSASTAAPTNGLVVNGLVGIGTTAPKSYSAMTVNGQLLSLNNLLINVGNTIKLNAYYNSGTVTDRAISTGFAADYYLNSGTGSLIFRSTATSVAADTNVTMLTRMEITSSGEMKLTPSANTTMLSTTGAYSLTGSNAQSLLDLAGTWNTTGNPTAIKLNITNTASGATADLMELQVGGVSQFLVSKAGNTEMTGSIKTAAPSGGTAQTWKLGEDTNTLYTATRTIRVEINGAVYYLLAVASSDL